MFISHVNMCVHTYLFNAYLLMLILNYPFKILHASYFGVFGSIETFNSSGLNASLYHDTSTEYLSIPQYDIFFFI